MSLTQHRNNLKTQGMQKLLGTVPLGLGVGVGARGLIGLIDMLRRHAKPPQIPARRTEVTIPFPAPAPEEEKTASTPAQPAQFGDDSVASKLTAALGVATPESGPRGGLQGHIMGDNGSSLADMPWYGVGLPVAMAGSLYGGYKLTDWLLGKARQNELDSELEKAQQDYENALMHNAKIGSAGGEAVASDTAVALDELAAAFEKDASALSAYTTALLLSMLLTGGGAGIATYNWAKQRQPENVLSKAYKSRQQKLYANQPFPVRAVPVGLPANQEKDEEPKTLPFPKAANDKVGPNAAADQFLQRKQQQAAAQAAAVQPSSSTTKAVPTAKPALPHVMQRTSA